MLKYFRVLLVSVAIVALSFGGALASDFGGSDPHIEWLHTSRAELVDGKSNYNAAQFMWAEFHINNTPLKSGTITLNAQYPAHVEYWNNEKQWEEIFVGEKTFPLLVRSDSDLGLHDDNGASAEFWERAEEHKNTQIAFSGQPFSFSVADLNVSGVFPKVHSTTTQMQQGCVPFVELITDNVGNMVTGVKWRFVNIADPSAAIKKNETSYNIKGISRVQIRLNNSNKTTYNERVDNLTFAVT